MSTEIKIVVCVLISVVALVLALGTLFCLGLLKLHVEDLEGETKLLYELSMSQQKYIDSFAKYFEKHIERENKQ